MTRLISVALKNIPSTNLKPSEQENAATQLQEIVNWLIKHNYSPDIMIHRYEQFIEFSINNVWKIKIVVDPGCVIPNFVNHGYPDIPTLLEYLPQEINWCEGKNWNFGSYAW